MSWAGSIAADIAGSLAEMEGECIGNPAAPGRRERHPRAWRDMPFDGYYICSAARHVFAPDSGGYTTWVTVGGYRDRSLFALSSGRQLDPAQSSHHSGAGDRHRRRQRRSDGAGPGEGDVPVAGARLHQRLVPGHADRRQQSRRRVPLDPRDRRRGAHRLRSRLDRPSVRHRQPLQRRRLPAAPSERRRRRGQPAHRVPDGPHHPVE